jgi:hypothetical protein
VKLNFQVDRLSTDQARYLIEAIFKAGEKSRRALISAAPKNLPESLDENTDWEELDFILYRTEETEILTDWIAKVCKKSILAARVCCCEVDYDLFMSSYGDLLALMDDGWPIRHTTTTTQSAEKVLGEILDFANKNQVPRVKLRLLLEFAGSPSRLVEESFDSLLEATKEINDTLMRMPQEATDRTNGRWFYQQRLLCLREFWAERCGMPISLGRSVASSLDLRSVQIMEPE